jgi:hypothetical protein
MFLDCYSGFWQINIELYAFARFKPAASC